MNTTSLFLSYNISTNDFGITPFYNIDTTSSWSNLHAFSEATSNGGSHIHMLSVATTKLMHTFAVNSTAVPNLSIDEAVQINAMILLMKTIVYPLLLTLGTFGNTMTILVLRKMLTDKSGFSLLFLALAISDLLLLYVWIMPAWVGYQFGFWIEKASGVLCKLSMWLVNSLQSLTSWLLAAMSFQRALYVVRPVWFHHTGRTTCNARRQALLTVAVLVTLSLAVYVDFLVNSDLSARGACEHTHDSAITVHFWLKPALNSILPSVVMVISNGVMIHAVLQSHKRAHEGHPNAEGHRNGAASRMTSTLILISFVFFVLTLPYYIMLIVSVRLLELTPAEILRYHGSTLLTIHATQLLYASNSALNFFLYILTGPKFRHEVERIVYSTLGICVKIKTSQPRRKQTDF